MKKILGTAFALLLFPMILLGQPKVWVSGYYAGWMQGYLPPSAIDFGAVTHIMHFSVEPSGANVSGTGNGIDAGAASAVITPAHAAGVKVLITCGGAGDDGAFLTATNSSNRAKFVSNLVKFAVDNGYDGIDIDWEPITSSSQFKLFIPQLRAAMDSAKTGMLLTIALLDGDDNIVAPVMSYFDQVNIMTYDISGAWEGWVTWHNSPISDGGFRFPSTGELIPSADGFINTAISAGITKSKLGIGTDWYGYVWTGVSQPRQGWTNAPDVTGNIPYYQLMNTYKNNTILWDSAAGAAYISITSPSQKFVSLDNDQTLAAKAQYIHTKGIGGIIIWELGGGYQPSLPAGQRFHLMAALKQAFMTTSAVAAASVKPLNFQLAQNYPNPFNPTTNIGYSIAGTGDTGPGTSEVRLVVYDILGREVSVLVNERQAPGNYEVRFDGRNLTTGVYFYRLTVGSTEFTRSMVLVK